MATTAARQPLTDNSDPVVSSLETFQLKRSFYVMSFCFGLNHAAVTTPVAYASSYLGAEVGQAANATLYGVCMVAALFLGPLTGGTLGPKWAMIFGMVCYCVYVIVFAIATGAEQGSGEAWFLAIGGSIVGGVGAGTLWTGQGGFFSAICERLSESSSVPLQQLTSKLASNFALFYLGQECFWKVLFTVLQKYCGMSNVVGFLLYGVLAAGATLSLALSVEDVRARNTQPRAGVCAKAAAAVALWRDPKIWLLSGNNLAFGFSAAYLNGYINATWQAEAIGGGEFIGFLGAVICAIATVSSKVYEWMSNKLDSKVPVLIIGSVCFTLIGVLSFITAPNGKGPGGWGWGIVVFYILQGLARGVYESTNKGIFGDTFPGAQGLGAFANCMMQNMLSSTIGFILGVAKLDVMEVWLLLVFALVGVPGVILAQRLHRQEQLRIANKDGLRPESIAAGGGA